MIFFLLFNSKFKSLLSGQLSHSSGVSSTAKMRPQKVVRPRPKTIHVETGSVDLSEASSLSNRKKGSNSNLTGMKMEIFILNY